MGLIEEEAMALAGEVIVVGFREWLEDRDTTELVNNHHETLTEMAFDYGIKELSEADLDLIEDLVDSATAFIDIGWTVVAE